MDYALLAIFYIIASLFWMNDHRLGLADIEMIGKIVSNIVGLPKVVLNFIVSGKG
jgi:hypothetical protein